MTVTMGTPETGEVGKHTQATNNGWHLDRLTKGTNQGKNGCLWHIPRDAECPKRLKI